MTVKGFSTPFGGYGTFAHHLPLRLDWIYLRGLSALRAEWRTCRHPTIARSG